MTPRAMKLSVCAQMGIDYDKLMGRTQSQYYMRARRVIARRLRDEYGMSWPDIGRELNRNHTTVLAMMGHLKTRPATRIVAAPPGVSLH